jgi:NADH-quinone oxidoreductase subunit G
MLKQGNEWKEVDWQTAPGIRGAWFEKISHEYAGADAIAAPVNSIRR